MSSRHELDEQRRPRDEKCHDLYNSSKLQALLKLQNERKRALAVGNIWVIRPSQPLFTISSWSSTSKKKSHQLSFRANCFSIKWCSLDEIASCIKLLVTSPTDSSSRLQLSFGSLPIYHLPTKPLAGQSSTAKISPLITLSHAFVTFK